MPLAQVTGAAVTSRQELPAGQLVHVAEPTTEEYAPSAHVVQAMEPPREAVPTAHSVGSYECADYNLLGDESRGEGE